MLRSLYVMLDYHIQATNGEIGRVQDFLFDEESWLVRYLVVELGSWGRGERVLVVPFALASSEWESKRLSVRLTLEQVRESPPIELDKPISMQRVAGLAEPGSHLRSMREVFGYKILAEGGELGSIEDFIAEDTSWVIHNLVVGLAAGPIRSVLISPEAIRSLSWHAKSAWINRPLPELTLGPEFDPASPVNTDVDNRDYDYYGRPASNG